MTPKRDPYPPSPQARISILPLSSQKSRIRVRGKATEPQCDVHPPTTNDIAKFVTSAAPEDISTPPVTTPSGSSPSRQASEPIYQGRGRRCVIHPIPMPVGIPSSTSAIIHNPLLRKQFRHQSPLHDLLGGQSVPHILGVTSKVSAFLHFRFTHPRHPYHIRHARSAETTRSCQIGSRNLYLAEVAHSLLVNPKAFPKQL